MQNTRTQSNGTGCIIEDNVGFVPPPVAEWRIIMKGYFTTDGYMGFVGNEYMLFASEADYLDYIS